MLKQKTKNKIYLFIGIVLFLILYALKNTSYFMRATGFVFSVLLFYLADFYFKFDFKSHHYLIFILISTAGILLSPLYFICPTYDKILHLIFPILLGILIFYLVNKTCLKFSTKLMVTAAFMISSLAIFEIGEYLLDILFDLKLQGVYLRDVSGINKLNILMDRNDDTMIDLILGALGTLFFVSLKLLIFNYKKYILKISN
jgi:hypothetical protein